MAVTRLGFKLELQLLAYTTATTMPNLITFFSLHCTPWPNWILKLWGRPGFEPVSSWILFGFLTCWATMGTPKREVLIASWLGLLKSSVRKSWKKYICLPLCSLTVRYYQCEDKYWEIVLINQVLNPKRHPNPSASLNSQTISQISSIFLTMNIQIWDNLEDQLYTEIDGGTCTEVRFISWQEDKHALEQVWVWNLHQW